MRLAEASAAYLPLVEAEMRALLDGRDADVAEHVGMMRYHLGWANADLAPTSAPSGKRIRPLICMLVCGAACGEPARAAPAGAGLELLHNFSLIHDDIEDDSPMRRHRPTVWKLYGVPLAINAGDGMFSIAHLAFFRLSQHAVPPECIVEALRVFDETCLALTEGQHLDMSFERRTDVAPEEYFKMIQGKTGALLAASAQIGAIVGSAAPEVVDGYRRFGAALGRAFQLRDDVLGIWGDESKTGKSAASDILSKKKSLPVLYAMATADGGAALRELYAGPALQGHDVPRVLAFLDRTGAHARVEHDVMEATAEAEQALASVALHADPRFTAPLRELLAALADRAS